MQSHKWMKILLILFTFVIASYTYGASSNDAMNTHSTVLTNKNVQWTDSKNLPKGAKIAVLGGDPTGSGLFTIRIKLPAHYQVPAHWHPTSENITVFLGTLYVGMGNKLDTKNATPIPPGGFLTINAKENHFAFTHGPVILQVHAEGPFQINYVDPKEAPRI